MTMTMSSGFIRVAAGTVSAARPSAQTLTSDEADDHIIQSEN
jgi:hypothetical protein